jgi:hypothetical protein
MDVPIQDITLKHPVVIQLTDFLVLVDGLVITAMLRLS